MGYVHNVWCHLHQSEDDLHGNKAFKGLHMHDRHALENSVQV